MKIKKIDSPVQVLRKEGTDRMEHSTMMAVLKVANPNREILTLPLFLSLRCTLLGMLGNHDIINVLVLFLKL